MKFKRISDFDTLYVQGNSDVAAVILHGYGASFNDLAPLHQYLDPDKRINWFFVDGPFSVDIGMGMTGKAWFPIDMVKLQMHIQAGKFEEVFYQTDPPGLKEVTLQITNYVRELKKDYKKVVLGGFSQGSMISTSIVLENKDLVDGLLLMSSTLYDYNRFEKSAENFKDLPIFQSHGMFDPVLPFNMSQKLYEILSSKSKDIHFESFEGGHEIPLPVINNAKNFLRKF